jgi:hypothetical protein
MADVRSELKNIGNIVVGGIEKTAGTAKNIGNIVVGCIEKTAGSAKKYAKGVALTYDIHEMNNKRQRCLTEIGRRLTQVSKEGLADVRKDDRLMELLSEANSIEKAIAGFKKEREELISFSSLLPKQAESTSS